MLIIKNFFEGHSTGVINICTQFDTSHPEVLKGSRNMRICIFLVFWLP